MSRDFTYIDDIVNGIEAAMKYTASDYEIINLGNNRGVTVLEVVEALAASLQVKPVLTFFPEQPGDVPRTYADIRKAQRLLGYEPVTPFHHGIARFVDWLLAARMLEAPEVVAHNEEPAAYGFPASSS